MVTIMNPDDLLKAAPEIAKGAGALAAAIPFTAIVKRMLVPAADELAEMWRDRVRLYRYGRQLKLLEKVENMAQEAGFTPEAVPPKILFPLLEGASFEENEDLHTMWAALLANAASPENAESVRPSFLAILKHMAPDEAKLLNWMYNGPYGQNSVDEVTVMEAYGTLGFGPASYADRNAQMTESVAFLERFEACLGALEAEQLVISVVFKEAPDLRFYSSTLRGAGFMKACRPPRAKP
jgi:hypothetical protein